MPLEPASLPGHPDGETVNLLDPGAVDYRSQSKWVDRFCGNCAWFEPQPTEELPDVTGDEHPAADGKGTVHRCALVGGGIAFGGYCVAWGTRGFAVEDEPDAEAGEVRISVFTGGEVVSG